MVSTGETLPFLTYCNCAPKGFLLFQQQYFETSTAAEDATEKLPVGNNF
jgi:hypothetical protein